MARKNVYQFVEENYVLDFTVTGIGNGKDFSDVPINVYRPRDMKTFPEYIRKRLVNRYSMGSWEDNHGKGWWDHTPGDASFSAATTVRYYPDKTIVYVCSIIKYPYTDEQEEYFDMLGCLLGADRLFTMWNSENDSPHQRAVIAKNCKGLPDFDGCIWPYRPEEYPELIGKLIDANFDSKDRACYSVVDRGGLHIDVDRKNYDRATWRSLCKLLVALNNHPLLTCRFKDFRQLNCCGKVDYRRFYFRVKL